jgi:CHAT domain-containing protein/tetratricopeptide (TPR) repeat protein
MIAEAMYDASDWRGHLEYLSLAADEAVTGDLSPEQQLDAYVDLTKAQHTFEEYKELEKTSLTARNLSKAFGYPDYDAFFLAELASAASGINKPAVAKRYNEELLALSQANNDNDGICTALNNLGLNALAAGDPEAGIEFLSRAIDLETDPRERAVETANLSRCYEQVGDWAQATALILQALAVVKELEEDEKIISYSLRTADLYFRIEDYPRARRYYQECLAVFNHYPKTELYLHALINIGLTHYRQDDYEEAKRIFARADAEAREQDASDNTWSILCEAIAGMHQRCGSFLLAREFYERSRTYSYDDQDETAPFNLGTLHHLAEDYPSAHREFSRAADLIEQQRQSVTGLARQTFDGQKASIYEYRSEVFARTNDLEAALWQLELLKERVNGNEPPLTPPKNWLTDIQSSLAPEEAILYYANTHHNIISLFVITATDVCVNYLPVAELMELTEPFATAITRHYHFTQDKLEAGGEYSRAALPYPSVFEAALLYYRNRITQPAQLQAAKLSRTRELASALYTFLLNPLQETLSSHHQVTIIPDRSLYLLPFATLVDQQGKYLTETSTLRTAPSLAALTRMRSENHPVRTGPSVSFAVSDYNSSKPSSAEPPATQGIKTVEEIPGLRVEVRQAIQRQDPLHWAYDQIGISGWSDLIGVDTEAHALVKSFPNLRSLSNEEVTVDSLQSPAAKSLLQQAPQVHFAGHGIAVPGLPELNALALHPSGKRQYLHRQLIEVLPLKGAIINLSACETALGAITKAGSINGILPAFLSAGAAGVCASLWSIYDKEHALLLGHLYQRVAAGEAFAEAITNTQRACLKGQLGPMLRFPVYWGSLVYYG